MASSLKHLEQILPHLYQLPVEFPFGPSSVKTHAYIIQRYNESQDKYENLMIYGSCHIKQCFDDIKAIGGISRIYINHRDEASHFHKLAFDLFGSPSYCHKNELESIQSKTGLIHNKNLLTFDYSNIHKEFDDFDIIPAPGHTPGTTFYRWRNKKDNDKYYLFSGDTIYTVGPNIDQAKETNEANDAKEENEASGSLYHWEAAGMRIHSYKGKESDMINTLSMLQDTKFDYLVPGLHGKADNVDCYHSVQSETIKSKTLDSMLIKFGSKQSKSKQSGPSKLKNQKL